MSYPSITRELRRLTNPIKAKILSGFFKTGKGEYGEGDRFLGITVPIQRKVAKNHTDVTFSDLKKLLSQDIHEYRFTALEILTMKFDEAFVAKDEKFCNKLVKFYLSNTKRVNNWDLVDTSASYILGSYLFEFKKDRKILYKLVRSKNLWERRIAIVSTYYFICQNDFRDTLNISKLLIDDEHDLIHKACGWMLREVGKRDKKILVSYLHQHASKMPRTMLRYAIEKFSDGERKRYLKQAR